MGMGNKVYFGGFLLPKPQGAPELDRARER
jgi:hypothetical protein